MHDPGSQLPVASTSSPAAPRQFLRPRDPHSLVSDSDPDAEPASPQHRWREDSFSSLKTRNSRSNRSADRLYPQHQPKRHSTGTPIFPDINRRHSQRRSANVSLSNSLSSASSSPDTPSSPSRRRTISHPPNKILDLDPPRSSSPHSHSPRRSRTAQPSRRHTPDIPTTLKESTPEQNSCERASRSPSARSASTTAVSNSYSPQRSSSFVKSLMPAAQIHSPLASTPYAPSNITTTSAGSSALEQLLRDVDMEVAQRSLATIKSLLADEKKSSEQLAASVPFQPTTQTSETKTASDTGSIILMEPTPQTPPESEHTDTPLTSAKLSPSMSTVIHSMPQPFEKESSKHQSPRRDKRVSAGSQWFKNRILKQDKMLDAGPEAIEPPFPWMKDFQLDPTIPDELSNDRRKYIEAVKHTLELISQHMLPTSPNRKDADQEMKRKPSRMAVLDWKNRLRANHPATYLEISGKGRPDVLQSRSCQSTVDRYLDVYDIDNFITSKGKVYVNTNHSLEASTISKERHSISSGILMEDQPWKSSSSVSTNSIDHFNFPNSVGHRATNSDISVASVSPFSRKHKTRISIDTSNISSQPSNPNTPERNLTKKRSMLGRFKPFGSGNQDHLRSESLSISPISPSNDKGASRRSSLFEGSFLTKPLMSRETSFTSTATKNSPVTSKTEGSFLSRTSQQLGRRRRDDADTTKSFDRSSVEVTSPLTPVDRMLPPELVTNVEEEEEIPYRDYPRIEPEVVELDPAFCAEIKGYFQNKASKSAFVKASMFASRVPDTILQYEENLTKLIEYSNIDLNPDSLPDIPPSAFRHILHSCETLLPIVALNEVRPPNDCPKFRQEVPHMFCKIKEYMDQAEKLHEDVQKHAVAQQKLSAQIDRKCVEASELTEQYDSHNNELNKIDSAIHQALSVDTRRDEANWVQIFLSGSTQKFGEYLEFVTRMYELQFLNNFKERLVAKGWPRAGLVVILIQFLIHLTGFWEPPLLCFIIIKNATYWAMALLRGMELWRNPTYNAWVCSVVVLTGLPIWEWLWYIIWFLWGIWKCVQLVEYYVLQGVISEGISIGLEWVAHTSIVQKVVEVADSGRQSCVQIQ